MSEKPKVQHLPSTTAAKRAFDEHHLACESCRYPWTLCDEGDRLYPAVMKEEGDLVASPDSVAMLDRKSDSASEGDDTTRASESEPTATNVLKRLAELEARVRELERFVGDEENRRSAQPERP